MTKKETEKVEAAVPKKESAKKQTTEKDGAAKEVSKPEAKVKKTSARGRKKGEALEPAPESNMKPKEKTEVPSVAEPVLKLEEKTEAVKPPEPKQKSEVPSVTEPAPEPKEKTKALKSPKPVSKPKEKEESSSVPEPEAKPEPPQIIEHLPAEEVDQQSVQDSGEEALAIAASPSETKPAPAVPAIIPDLKHMRQEFAERANVIKQEMRNIQNSFLVIGFQLHWIKTNNMYRILDYKNIYDYAEKEYGIKKSTCGNFINIIENFAERNADGKVIESIADCFRNFSSSQLVAMLGMPEEMQQKVTPDMSVRSINRLRKGEPEKPPVADVKATETVITKAPAPEKPAMAMVIQKPVMPSHIQKPAVQTAAQQKIPLASIQKPSEPQAPEKVSDHSPRTLVEISSYSVYKGMAAKIDALIQGAFTKAGAAKVRIVYE